MDARGAATVEEYLDRLPADRRDAIAQVRDVVNANLPAGFEEGIQYGMISWYVPLSRFPETYNGQPLAIASLASQKGYMALYLISVYGHPGMAAWFRGAFAKAGKKLDMGKSCVRFKSVDALPLEVIGETIRRVPVDAFLQQYEDARASAKRAKPAAKKPAAKAKRPAAKAKQPAAKAKQPAAKAKQPAAKQPAAKKPAAKARRPAAKRPAAKQRAAKQPKRAKR
jgi:hypothetical protein